MIPTLRMPTAIRSPIRLTREPRRSIAVICASAIVPLLFIATGFVSAAGASSAVTLNGTINGQALSTSSQSNAVRLYPLRANNIVLTVHNHSQRPVSVASVSLSGEVIGLKFFAFDNSVAFTVPPQRSVTNRYAIPLVGLSGQATGLVNGSLSVLNPSQQVIASQNLVVDVRGSLWSVYGVFGLAVALLTVFAFVWVLLELMRHRLPANRFLRGLYFLVPGLGLGLVLVFTLSATRVFVPSAGHWVPLVLVSGIVFFIVGFLTPDPRIEEEEEQEDDGESFESLAMSQTAVASVQTPLASEHAVRMASPPRGPGSADSSTTRSTPPSKGAPALPSTQFAGDGATPEASGSTPAPTTLTDPNPSSSVV
jgi:hypothetical protein